MVQFGVREIYPRTELNRTFPSLMALEESQDCSSVARGWEAMSFFVCFLYAFKAAENIVSKFGEEVEVDRSWDIFFFFFESVFYYII
jgi:hypothetical protein